MSSPTSNTDRLTQAEIGEHARRDALKGPPDPTRPCDTERRLHGQARADHHEAQFARAIAAAEATEAFDKADRALPDDQALPGQIEPSSSLFRQQLGAKQPAISRAIREEFDTQREFDAFCGRNKVYRAARYPDNQTLFWLAPAALAFGLESAVNVALFGEHLSSGALAAFGLSAGVSFVNGSFAVVGAELSRNLCHRLPGRRLLGFLGVLLAAAVIVLLHLTYAHFRTLLQRGGAGDTAGILHHAFSSPLNLNFQGVLLLALGLGAAGAIWHRAFHADDPYPGFGAVDRARRAAQQRADTARTILSDTRRDLLHRAREATQNTLATYDTGVGRMCTAVAKLSAVDDSFSVQVQAIHDRLTEDWCIYWSEFARVRPCDLPPRAAAPPSIDACVEPVPLSTYEGRLEAARRRREALRRQAQVLLLGFDAWMEQATGSFLGEIESAARNLRDHANASRPALTFPAWR